MFIKEKFSNGTSPMWLQICTSMYKKLVHIKDCETLFIFTKKSHLSQLSIKIATRIFFNSQKKNKTNFQLNQQTKAFKCETHLWVTFFNQGCKESFLKSQTFKGKR